MDHMTKPKRKFKFKVLTRQEALGFPVHCSGKEGAYQPAGHLQSCLLQAFALFQSDCYSLHNPPIRQSLNLTNIFLLVYGHTMTHSCACHLSYAKFNHVDPYCVPFVTAFLITFVPRLLALFYPSFQCSRVVELSPSVKSQPSPARHPEYTK